MAGKSCRVRDPQCAIDPPRVATPAGWRAVPLGTQRTTVAHRCDQRGREHADREPRPGRRGNSRELAVLFGAPGQWRKSLVQSFSSSLPAWHTEPSAVWPHVARADWIRHGPGAASRHQAASGSDLELARQTANARKSRSSRSAARAASAMAVSTGFFSGPVVNTEESATTTLGAP